MRLGLKSRLAPVEPPSHDQLEDPAIRSRRSPDPHTEIDLPVRRDIQIHSGKYHLLLIVKRQDVAEASIIAVILHPAGYHLREVPAQLHPRRKVHPILHAGPVKGALERRVNRPVEPAHLFVDNRPDLPRPGIRRILCLLVPDLLRQAQSHRPLPLRRNPHPRPYVVAHPVPAGLAVRRSKDVEPDLGPVINALGNLHRFMQGVVGGRHARLGRLSIARVVRVNLEHGVRRLHSIGAVNLDLVVALGPGYTSACRQDEERNYSFQVCSKTSVSGEEAAWLSFLFLRSSGRLEWTRTSAPGAQSARWYTRKGGRVRTPDFRLH